MGQIIHFKCPECEIELETAPEDARGMTCSECGSDTRLAPSEQMLGGSRVDTCAACGHDNLYIQKDFNRALGLTIVVLGVLVSVVFFARNQPFYAMLALVAMAAIDGAVYLLVGEVTVCYVCHTLYRGFGRNPDHAGFDLELLERYGGRTPRR